MAARTWLSPLPYSLARPGRFRLLRAAWRPCSRGPARRAAVVGVGNSSEPVGSIVSYRSQAGRQRSLFPVASHAPCRPRGHGAYQDETPGQSVRK
jgi:hypothetical protein